MSADPADLRRLQWAATDASNPTLQVYARAFNHAVYGVEEPGDEQVQQVIDGLTGAWFNSTT